MNIHLVYTKCVPLHLRTWYLIVGLRDAMASHSSYGTHLLGCVKFDTQVIEQLNWWISLMASALVLQSCNHLKANHKNLVDNDLSPDHGLVIPGSWIGYPRIMDWLSQDHGLVIPGLWIGYPRIMDWLSQDHGLVIPGSWIGYPRIMDWLSQDHGLVIPGSWMGYPRIMDGLSQDHGWVIPGSWIGYPRITDLLS